MPTNAEVTAWVSAIGSAGGTVSAGDTAAVDTFVSSAKSHSYWTKLLDCGVFVGNQLAAAMVKLIAYTGTAASLTNTNFVSGDYSATRGLIGGSGKYLDTGFNYQTYGTGVIGHSFFLNDHIRRNASNAFFMGRSNGLGEPYMQMYGAANPTGAYNGSYPSMPVESYGAGIGRGTREFEGIINGNLIAFSMREQLAAEAACEVDTEQGDQQCPSG